MAWRLFFILAFKTDKIFYHVHSEAIPRSCESNWRYPIIYVDFNRWTTFFTSTHFLIYLQYARYWGHKIIWITLPREKKNPENKELANQAIKYKLWGWQKDQNIFRNPLLETLFDLLAATILFVSFTSLLNSRLKETESTFTTIFCLPMLSIWFVLLQFVYVQSPTKADICSYYAFGSIKRVLIRFCIIDKMCSNCSEFIDLMFINSWT